MVVRELDWLIKGLTSGKDITLLTKLCIVSAMVFLVVRYTCEIQTVKKTERQRIDAFELWCWRRLLRVPWTAKRSNQSILKGIKPGYSLEGLMLKLQYFGHLMRWNTNPLEKTLMLGKIEGRRRRGKAKNDYWLNGQDFEQTLGVVEEKECCSPWGCKESDTT